MDHQTPKCFRLKPQIHGNIRARIRNRTPLACVFTIGCTLGAIYYYTTEKTWIHNDAKPSSTSSLPSDSRQNPFTRPLKLTDIGVLAWGSNRFNVVAPTQDSLIIKTPLRIPIFDDIAFRHVVLGRKYGAAVDLNGNIWQWGASERKYPENLDITDIAISSGRNTSRNFPENVEKGLEPKLTLKGKDIVQLAATESKLYALSRYGNVYVLDANSADKPVVSAPWYWPFGDDSVKVRVHNNETVTEISSGSHHLLALTRSGNVLAAVSDEQGNASMQCGKVTANAIDVLNPITGLMPKAFAQVAAGELHSLARSKDGLVYAWGSNSAGQCGDDKNFGTKCVPSKIRLSEVYPRGDTVVCSRIAAGGNNSYFVVNHLDASTDKMTDDVLSLGVGIYGSLGNNMWSHVQPTPVRVRSISGISEFSEKLNKVVPIRIYDIVAGHSHAVVVLDNDTTASKRNSEDRRNGGVDYFGRDIVTWGSNQDYQLGNGKRINQCVPRHVPSFVDYGANFVVEENNGNNQTNDMSISPSARLQLVPKIMKKVKTNLEKGSYRNVLVEQAVAVGYGTTLVYYRPALAR